MHDIAVGDEISRFTRTTGFANWNRYAAVNDELAPGHAEVVLAGGKDARHG